MEKFITNLAASFGGYIAVILYKFLLLIPLLSFGGVPFTGRPFPLWAEIVLLLHVILVAAFFFFLGTKLNLLCSYWLNFLSVCGILVIGLPLAIFPNYLSIFVQLPFWWLGLLMANNIDNIPIELSILAILPSILIWLGMLYKSRNE